MSHTTMSYLGQVQNLDWASPGRIFTTTDRLFNSQPNYEHELAIALDTRIKYQGIAPVVGGWGFATGAPGPTAVPPPAHINDEFTWVYLSFDGIEGGWHEYRDTNARGIPRVWTQRSGFGRLTNIREKFYPSALVLDGNTVITAPDAIDFNFATNDFTVRGWFTCEFGLNERRTLVAKSYSGNADFVFFVDRDEAGHIVVRDDTFQIVPDVIQDRFGQTVQDRVPTDVIARSSSVVPVNDYLLMSTTTYQGTGEMHVPWHSFKYVRQGDMLRLFMDDVEEDNMFIDAENIFPQKGPLMIGGYTLDGVTSKPWIGMFSRFGIDIGIARI